MNSNEIICWSYTERYFSLDYEFKKQLLKPLHFENMTGVLIFVTDERIFFMSDKDFQIKILDRSTGELVGSIEIESSSVYCIRIDALSRAYVKTRRDLLSRKMACYDKNGKLLVQNDLHDRLEIYDSFSILDEYSVHFIDFNQNNSVLF